MNEIDERMNEYLWSIYLDEWIQGRILSRLMNKPKNKQTNLDQLKLAIQ